jgi:hypothetical protein
VIRPNLNESVKIYTPTFARDPSALDFTAVAHPNIGIAAGEHARKLDVSSSMLKSSNVQP